MSSFAIDVGASNFDEIVIRGSRDRPVLVDFWAPWCGPCRMLAPILDKLAAEMGGRFTLAKLNTDDEQELAARYGIRGIPNVKAFVDGRVADEFTGVQPEAGVRAFLERVMPSPAARAIAEAKARLAAKDAVGALAKLDEAHALDPDGEDALLTRAEALVALGRGADAGHVLDALEAPARVRTKPVRAERRLATLRARAKLAAGGGAGLAALARRAAARHQRLDGLLAAQRRTEHLLDHLVAQRLEAPVELGVGHEGVEFGRARHALATQQLLHHGHPVAHDPDLGEQLEHHAGELVGALVGEIRLAGIRRHRAPQPGLWPRVIHG